MAVPSGLLAGAALSIAVGGVLLRIRVASGEVATWPCPSSTVTRRVKPAGPSSMPSAWSGAQVNVGLAPPVAPAWLLTVHEYVSGTPSGLEAEAVSASELPSPSA